MTTASVTAGSGVERLIVCGPAPGMLKRISSAPGAAFASTMAWRSEPGPLSFVLVTRSIGSSMVIVNNPVMVCAGVPASPTCTVKVQVPRVVGVPERTPLVNVIPGGIPPNTMSHSTQGGGATNVHVYGDVPPVTASVPVYAAPWAAFGNVGATAKASGGGGIEGVVTPAEASSVSTACGIVRAVTNDGWNVPSCATRSTTLTESADESENVALPASAPSAVLRKLGLLKSMLRKFGFRKFGLSTSSRRSCCSEVPRPQSYAPVAGSNPLPHGDRYVR